MTEGPREMIHSNAWRSAPSCIRLSLTCKIEKRCHCKAEDKPSRTSQERVEFQLGPVDRQNEDACSHVVTKLGKACASSFWTSSSGTHPYAIMA